VSSTRSPADDRDGLHLSGKGHKLVFDEVERVMKANLGEWDPDLMKESDVDVPSPLALPEHPNRTDFQLERPCRRILPFPCQVVCVCGCLYACICMSTQ